MKWGVAAIAVGVVWLGISGMRWLLAKVRDLLKPAPDDGTRCCPHCGHTFEGTRRYCLACGGQIWDDVFSR